MSALAIGAALMVIALAITIANVVWQRRARASLSERPARAIVKSAPHEIYLSASRAATLASRESLEAVFATFDRAARALSPSVDAVAIYRADASTATCVYATGERIADFAGTTVRLDSTSVIAAAFRGSGAGELVHPSDRTALAIPVQLETGAFVAYLGSLHETSLDDEVLMGLVEQLAPAFTLALDFDRYMEAATFDVTGLLSKRALAVRLAEEIARAVASRTPFCLMFADLDGMKGWNDSFGHHSGDLLILQFAEIIKCNTEVTDIIGHEGGDEFIVLAIGAPKSAAVEAALNIGADVAHADRQSLVPPGTLIAPERVVTASIGVVSYPDDVRGSSVDEILNEVLYKADKELLYFAKEQGRDRVAFYDRDQGRQTQVSSEFERRDPDSRPTNDRRNAERPFMGEPAPARRAI